MKFLKNLTVSVKLSLRIFLIQATVLLVYRLAFVLIFYKSAGSFSSSEFLRAFYIGLKFDLRFAAALGLISLLFGVIIFKNRKFINKIIISVFTILQTSVLIFYLFDFGNYFYLQSRITSAIVKFTQDPLISAEMVWQTYPLFWISILILFLGFVFYTSYSRFVFNSKTNLKNTYPIKLRHQILPWFALVSIYGGMIYGKMSWYPLRWSEAFFSSHNYLTALALNPLLYFVDTFKFKEDRDTFEKEFLTYRPDILNYLGLDPAQVQKNLIRDVPKVEEKIERPNIVVIVLESQAAYKTGIMGSGVNPTPHLDALANESLLFTKFYVPTQATARSMFTLVTGTPDLSLVKTGSRNPFLVNQHTIINEFKDYKRLFFIGGSANWGNIRGIYTHNIDNLELFEEEDYKSPRMDVWGISDYHLFIEANEVIKTKTEPFIAIIQTAGFHRPYTIPEERGGFKLADKVDEETLRKNGFNSNEELNSLRWQDYALGNYFELVKKEKYYENTIFVVYGDHGLPVEDAEHVPAGERIHNFENFHVPLVIHSPKYFQPSIDNKITSQMDLWPTLASFVGIPYRNTTLGRDVFDPKFADRKHAFLYFWYTFPPQFGVIDENYFVKDDLDSISALYDYKALDPSVDIKDLNPEVFMMLRNFSLGFYYSSKYLMMNNQK